jgi:hypothetical protein
MGSHCRGTDSLDPRGQLRARLRLRSRGCAFDATALASRIRCVTYAGPSKGRSPRFRPCPAPPRYGLVFRTDFTCLRSRIIRKFPHHKGRCCRFTENPVLLELDPSLVYSVRKVRHLYLDRADQEGELHAAHPSSFCECRRWSPPSRLADLTIETRIGAGGHISPNRIRSAIQYAVLRCRPLLLFVCSPLFGLDGAVERSGSELAFRTQRSTGRTVLRRFLCSRSFQTAGRIIKLGDARLGRVQLLPRLVSAGSGGVPSRRVPSHLAVASSRGIAPVKSRFR